MTLLDRLRDAGRRFGQEVGDSHGALVYLRQLLRGNEAPPAAGVVGVVPREPVTGVPVLLIHGYLANRGSVHLLERRLCEKGHVVMTFRPERMHTGDIRDTAGLVARKVESLCTQAPVDKVDIIGHSMGGLVGLDYVKRLGGRHRVRRLILLGTPADGTWSALLGLVTAPLGPASRQLLPGSRFLRELHEAPIPPGVEVTTVAGDRDLLAPLGSTEIPGVQRVVVPASHAGLLVDEQVAEALDAILKAPPRPAV